jgi:hypothetical protein
MELRLREEFGDATAGEGPVRPMGERLGVEH